MKRTKLLTLIMAMVMTAMCPVKMWAETEYQVGTTAEWNSVMSKLKDVSSSTDVKITLTGDFTVTSPAEISDKVNIELQGKEHVITLKINSTDEYTGLFKKLYGGWIRELWLKGSITTSKKYLGSVCGQISSKQVNLSCVYSEVTLKSTVSGDATAGGLVGEANAPANLTACAYVGTLEGGLNSSGECITDKMCGMIGFNSQVRVNFDNCYQAATWKNVKSGDNYAFMRNDDLSLSDRKTTYNNYCLYLAIGPGGKRSDKSGHNAVGEDLEKETIDNFKSGKTALLLNGTTSYYRQNIDKGTPDTYPVPFASHSIVYYHYAHGNTVHEDGFSNVKVLHTYYDRVLSETWTDEATPSKCRCTIKLGCTACDLTVTETITPTCTTQDATCKEKGGYVYNATSSKYKHEVNFAAVSYSFNHSYMNLPVQNHGYKSGFTRKYAWSGQSYNTAGTCQGTLHCNNCGDDIETVALTVTSKTFTTSTCTTQGTRVWSASGKSSITGQADYAAESDEYKDALKSHGYSKGFVMKYSWNGANYSSGGWCQGRVECGDCGKCLDSKQLKIETNTLTEVTCTTDGVHTWKATGTNIYGEDYYSISPEYTNPAIGHIYSDETSACTKCNTYQYGDGTAASPYLISKAGELGWYRDQVNTAVVDGEKTTYPYASICAQLNNDIDLSTLSGNWIPIGTGATYIGTFDGQGHSITGMSILNYTTNNQGLFGTTGEGSNIKHFTLSGEMTSSTSGLRNIGAVVASAGYKTNISDVTSNVNITLTEGTTQSYIAGIAGDRTSRTTLTRCVNNGNIDAGASVECIGGMMAFVGGYGSTNYCLNTGNITTTGNNAYIAGMVAYQNDGQHRFTGAHHCLNTGKISAGTDTYAGAIYGRYLSTANHKGENNYYLETSATKAVGQNTTTDDLTGVCAAVVDGDLKSGKTCYLLNSGNTTSPVWKQTLGTALIPQLSGDVVYYDTDMLPFYYNEGTQRHLAAKGDLNGDGSITIADLTLLIQILGSNGTITNPAADVDGNGSINLDDANTLHDKILETK